MPLEREQIEFASERSKGALHDPTFSVTLFRKAAGGALAIKCQRPGLLYSCAPKDATGLVSFDAHTYLSAVQMSPPRLSPNTACHKCTQHNSSRRTYGFL